jgi:hypothetical protein
VNPVNPHLITPLLVTALVLWGLYRRVRRIFGRQAVKPARLYIRAGVLGLLGALLLPVLWRDSTLLVTLLGGVVCGAVLSEVGLRHTRFEATPQGRFYTPHAYIGLVVLALFVGRLIFEFVDLYSRSRAGVPPRGDPLAMYRDNPLTLALFGLLIGYYVLYNLGVLRRARDLAPAIP